MTPTNRGGWKTCSRGHKYRGSFCPKCNPGRAERESDAAPKARRAAKRGAAKRAVALFLAATMLSTAPPLGAQSSPARTPPSAPSAPHERLSFFEGEWTVEEVPAARAFRERCAWMEGGRRHMVCRSRSTTTSGEWRETMSMFSYRPVDSAYVYYGLRASGATQLLLGRQTADGAGWEFEGDERDAGGRLRTRVRIARLTAGRFRLVEQTSRDDAPFSAGDSVHYRPARPEPGAP